VADADQAIGSLVYRLRKKIEPPGTSEPLYIQTVPGRGFRLQNVV
jgi:DNA-binding winged helix-turn-helix (wHTH) protein